LEAVANKDPLIKKAVIRLMEISADEKNRMLYEANERARMDAESREDYAREEGHAEGHAEGLVEGETKGETKKAFTIARNLLRRNRPIDEIMEDTGLSRSEVEDLRNAN